MIIDKPPWISHGDAPIFAIDVDPTGKRVATCGSDHKVKIWNTQPILNQTKENDPQTARLLAVLMDHVGAVNVVRFAPKGNFVASAGDDKVICIHELKGGPGKAAFGSTDGPNLENWKQIVALHGHNETVADLNWSPGGEQLASASMDNTVIVWDASSGRRVTTLVAHEGFAKGVAWDPLGKYLASQGEDAVFIWRCEDWMQVQRIPLKNCLSTTFHHRLCWTPDGQELAVVCVLEQPTHTVQLYKRNVWTSNICMAGHKAPVGVVRYNPKFFYRPNNPNSEDVDKCMAVGSHDAQFTVWRTGHNRPLLLGTKFCRMGVLDVAWSPDGYTLYLCSYDGTVAVCRFTEEELGRAVPEHEVQQMLRELGGTQKASARQALPEGVEVMQLELQEAAAPPPTARPSGPLTEQSNHMDKLSTRMLGSGVPSTFSKPQAAPALQAPAATGPRRITPVAASENMPAPAVPAAAPPRRITALPTGEHAAAAAGTQASPARPPHAAAVPTISGVPVPVPVASSGSADGGQPAAKRIALQPVSQPAATQPSVAAAAAARREVLSLPTIQASISAKLGKREDLAGSAVVVLQAVNTEAPQGGQRLSRLVCTCGAQQLWTDLFPGPVALLAGNLNFSAVASATGDLQVYTAAGRRLLPTIALRAPPGYLDVDCGWQLLVVTVDGSLQLFDLHDPQDPKCLVQADLGHFLWKCGDAKVFSVKLTTSGLPLVVLTNRSAFLYQPDMNSWYQVADEGFARSSFHSTLLSIRSPLDQKGDLAHLYRTLPRTAPSFPHTSPAPAGQQAQRDRVYLENNVACSLYIKSPEEYRLWLQTYVRHLALDKDEGARLREVVEELRGPLHASGSSWQPTVLGLAKRDLLALVLREVGRGRQHQQLVTETKDFLRRADEEVQRQQRQQQQQQPSSPPEPMLTDTAPATRTDPDAQHQIGTQAASSMQVVLPSAQTHPVAPPTSDVQAGASMQSMQAAPRFGTHLAEMFTSDVQAGASMQGMQAAPRFGTHLAEMFTSDVQAGASMQGMQAAPSMQTHPAGPLTSDVQAGASMQAGPSMQMHPGEPSTSSTPTAAITASTQVAPSTHDAPSTQSTPLALTVHPTPGGAVDTQAGSVPSVPVIEPAHPPDVLTAALTDPLAPVPMDTGVVELPK